MVSAINFILVLFSLFSNLTLGSENNKVSDKLVLDQARHYYDKGQLDNAIKFYSKISASSDFWLESIEERAWAYTRQGNYEKALADLHSITSSVWEPQVGPETYMLSTFVSLKICAYKDVIKKIKTFKKVMLPRIDNLESLKSQAMNEELWQKLLELKTKKVTLMGLGKDADKLPRYFYRDKKLLQFIKSNRKNLALTRLKDLAQNDLDEISLNLKKMKVIDVQLMQTVLTMDKELNEKNKKLKFSKIDKDNSVSFPVTDDEVWIDEVGQFQVKADACPFSKRTL
ncbi:MAG: hypothetical protein KDD45_00900 [Bdellovibrionales bacterium]|nr:hypothetical protein [Bdellovibrionales bacterium]